MKMGIAILKLQCDICRHPLRTVHDYHNHMNKWPHVKVVFAKFGVLSKITNKTNGSTDGEKEITGTNMTVIEENI